MSSSIYNLLSMSLSCFRKRPCRLRQRIHRRRFYCCQPCRSFRSCLRVPKTFLYLHTASKANEWRIGMISLNEKVEHYMCLGRLFSLKILNRASTHIQLAFDLSEVLVSLLLHVLDTLLVKFLLEKCRLSLKLSWPFI